MHDFIDILSSIFSQYSVQYRVPDPENDEEEEGDEEEIDEDELHAREEAERELSRVTDINRIMDILVGETTPRSAVSMDIDNLEEVLLMEMQQSAPDFEYTPPVAASKSEDKHQWGDLYSPINQVAEYVISSPMNMKYPVQRMVESEENPMDKYDRIGNLYGP